MPPSLGNRPKPVLGPAVTIEVYPLRVTGPVCTRLASKTGATVATSAAMSRFGRLNRSFIAASSSHDGCQDRPWLCWPWFCRSSESSLVDPLERPLALLHRLGGVVVAQARRPGRSWTNSTQRDRFACTPGSSPAGSAVHRLAQPLASPRQADPRPQPLRALPLASLPPAARRPSPARPRSRRPGSAPPAGPLVLGLGIKPEVARAGRRTGHSNRPRSARAGAPGFDQAWRIDSIVRSTPT